MVLQIILAVIGFYVLGLGIVMWLVRRAPKGREDADGFHLEAEEETAAKSAAARPIRVWRRGSPETPVATDEELAAAARRRS